MDNFDLQTVREITRPHSPSSYFINILFWNGKRQQLHFATKEARNKRFDALKKELKKMI